MKVGIVGVGPMGLHHAQVLRGMPIVRELRGCDLSPAMRKKAKTAGVPCVKDLEELIAWKPDAALVVTPPAAHAPVIEPLLRARIPVLTEKPLASNLRDCRRMVKLS